MSVKTFFKVVFILVIFQALACGETMYSFVGNSFELEWSAPLTNTDGSEINDLCGYRVYYGRNPRNYTAVVWVSSHDTTTLVRGLGSGTYYFAVTAYDYFGNESYYSNEVFYSFE